MGGNQVRDFADRVKKFYYYRALLCDKLMNREVAIQGNSIEMPPQEFNPFNNLYIDAYVIGCAAFEGLSSIWQALKKEKITSSQDRFVCFLLHLKVQAHLDRVSTPFLNYFLEKNGIEEPLRQEIKNEWIKNRDQYEGHRVYDEPTIAELKAVYDKCHQQNSISPQQTIKNNNIDKVFQKFTYAALIYNFYRCSYIHEFRDSSYVATFNTGNQISVRQCAVDRSRSQGETKPIRHDGVKPQLDVGIGVLTESIRKGANIVHNLILESQDTNIPYNSSEDKRFEELLVGKKKSQNLTHFIDKIVSLINPDCFINLLQKLPIRSRSYGSIDTCDRLSIPLIK